MTVTPIRGKRAQNKLDNRSAIVDAARRCFAEQGYDAVTIRDVIRMTDLASGTYYNYFLDKESLFRAVLEEGMTALTDRLTQARRQARNMESFVRGAYRVAFEGIVSDPDFFQMLFRNEPVIRQLHSDSVMGMSLVALKKDLTDAIHRGILPEMDVELLAASLFGAGFEIGRVLMTQKDPQPEKAAEFATRVFLGGIQAFGSDKPVTLKPRVRAQN